MRGIKFMAISAMTILVGCQTNEPVRATPEVYFTARGNEPGWIVRFDSEKIAFEGDYGEIKITVAKPEGRPSFNGMRYISDRMSLLNGKVTTRHTVEGDLILTNESAQRATFRQVI